MLLTKLGKRSQAGLGLLELMLAMVIVALLLIMATRYYNSARTAARVQQATKLIDAAYAAANQLSVSAGGYSDIRSDDVKALLPGQVLTGPWGFDLSISNNDSDRLPIKLQTDSEPTCKILQATFGNMSGVVANCDRATITVTFYYSGTAPK